MKPCYLICGVSGSGKSWLCRQLTDKFNYIPHDEHFKDQVFVVWEACSKGEKPVITECPFAERVLKAAMEEVKVPVIPYFVIEHPSVVAERYRKREGKMLPQNAHTRASTILERALEWKAPYGTSDQVLSMLKNLKLPEGL